MTRNATPLLQDFAIESRTLPTAIEAELAQVLCGLASVQFCGLNGSGKSRALLFQSRASGVGYSVSLQDVARGGAEIIRKITREGDESFWQAELDDALEFENKELA